MDMLLWTQTRFEKVRLMNYKPGLLQTPNNVHVLNMSFMSFYLDNDYQEEKAKDGRDTHLQNDDNLGTCSALYE